MTAPRKSRIAPKWLLLTLLLVALPLFAVAIFQWKIDPFGVFAAQPVPGLNNFKPIQITTSRLFKPYQYQRQQPDMVFLGTSRVEYGLIPHWPPHPEWKIYNFGLGSGNIREFEGMTGVLLQNPNLKMALIEISPLMFAHRMDPFAAGYSQSRNNLIARGPFWSFTRKIKDTVFNLDALNASFDTIKESSRQPNTPTFSDNGLYAFGTQFRGPLEPAFRKLMWNYANGFYARQPYGEECFAALIRTVNTLKSHGVQVVAFTPPLFYHLQAILEAQGWLDPWEKTKTRVVKEVMPLWDFAHISTTTLNARNYVDGSHFVTRVGDQLIDKVSAGPTPEDRIYRFVSFGVYLTPENVDRETANMSSSLAMRKSRSGYLWRIFQDAFKTGDKTAFATATDKMYTF